MSHIKIDEIVKNENELSIRFDVSENLKKYFTRPYVFSTSYSFSVVDCPNSLAVIPFMCNVLPIAWLSDSTIYVEELDKDFNESIPEFKNGYVNMYPSLKFKGLVKCNNLKDNTLPPPPHTPPTQMTMNHIRVHVQHFLAVA